MPRNETVGSLRSLTLKSWTLPPESQRSRSIIVHFRSGHTSFGYPLTISEIVFSNLMFGDFSSYIGLSRLTASTPQVDPSQH